MKAMRRRQPGLWAKSHQATPADEYQQERLPLMPQGEMGGRRLLPGLEIARPYNTRETPLLATWSDGAQELANAQEAGYLASEYGECGDLVNE